MRLGALSAVDACAANPKTHLFSAADFAAKCPQHSRVATTPRRGHVPRPAPLPPPARDRAVTYVLSCPVMTNIVQNDMLVGHLCLLLKETRMIYVKKVIAEADFVLLLRQVFHHGIFIWPKEVLRKLATTAACTTPDPIAVYLASQTSIL